MDIKLPTGAQLTVTESSFQDVDALMSALSDAGIGVPLANDLMGMDVTVLKDALLKAYKSDALKNAIFKCGERAMYENVKVTRALFDDPKLKDQARADYFLILWHIVEVNCAPFFVKIFSALRERLKTSPFSPQSSSVPAAAS